MKVPLPALLLLCNGLHLDALRLSPAAVSEAFFRHSYFGGDTIRAFDKNNTKKWSRSSSLTQSSFLAPSFRNQNNQHRYNNDARLLGRKYIMASSIAPNQNVVTSYCLHASSSIHHTTNSSTQQQVSILSQLRHVLNRIRHFMLCKWSQALKLFRILTISSILFFPSAASSSSSPSLEYYLQNNPHQTTTQLQTQQRSEISIQTQSSQPYSNNNINTVKSRRQYPQTTRFVKRKTTTTQTQKVKRTTLLIMLLTLAASSFRASLRKSKVARTTTPFGIIRNVSPLGNGVSVIRVCMALKFDNNDEIDKDKAKSLLNKLYLEEKELYTKISMLSQDPQVQLNGAYFFRQEALGRYLSNVASTFLQYTNHIRYGSMESIRVPFVEDAVKEFRQVAKEERQVFATTMTNQKKKMSETMQKKQQQEEEVCDGTNNSKDSNSMKRTSGYILATILLSIKGDRTSVPLPFGILRQRDVGRALSRIVTDAKVEDCLVASEINWVPNLINPITGNHDVADVLLSEKDVLKAFPDLVSLT